MWLEICYYDDVTEVICTGEDWGACDGAIRENDIINGETKDFRREHETIFTGKYIGKLNRVTIFEEPMPIQENVCERVKICEHLVAKYLVKKDNFYIADFCQNFAGVASVTVNGVRGQKITMRHAEMLSREGTLYTANYRSVLNTDTIILKDSSKHSYMPSFTYHGFRYIELSSDKPFKITELIGCVTHNDLNRTGEFSCSNKLINKIYSNALWGQRSNFLSVPTDCPQRDERLGWLADTHLFSKTACYNMDCKKFYRKFMTDILDSANESGIPDYAPFVNIFGRGNAGWADCAVILPYTYYLMYGDKSIITDYLSVMTTHIESIVKTSENGIRNVSAYSDWLNVDENTASDVFATAYLYHSLDLYCKMLELININNSQYMLFKETVRAAFIREFVTVDYRIKSDSQTAYLIAYAFGLMSAEKVKPHLIRKINQKNIHLSTGFVGCKYLLPVLSDLGLDEYAYDIILNEDYPSWGYSIANGATTIWERWNSFTNDEGFGDDGMNSFNHYSFGSCVEWLYEYVLGIKCIEPGFKRISICPHFDPQCRVKSAKGSYESESGKIEVSYNIVDEKCFFTVKCPDQIKATFDFGDNVVIKNSYCKNIYSYVIKLDSNVISENLLKVAQI